METVKMEKVEQKIITIRNQQVLLDSDVADLYGVKTKEVNQAVKNNADKFPHGYIIELTDKEKQEVVKIFDHLAHLKFSSFAIKAFTEKGLYMLATILKSPTATATTIAIVEAFAKIRELARNVSQLAKSPKQHLQKQLMKQSGDIINEILGSDLQVTDSETIMEINFAVMKFKHTIKRKKKP